VNQKTCSSFLKHLQARDKNCHKNSWHRIFKLFFFFFYFVLEEWKFTVVRDFNLLFTERTNTYSPLVGWCRTMWMMRPGGYSGWWSVSAILESEGWTATSRATSFAFRYSVIWLSSAFSSAAEVGSDAQPQHTTLQTIVFHCMIHKF